MMKSKAALAAIAILVTLACAPDYAMAEQAPAYLVQWGVGGGGNAQFNEPRGIACSNNGYVYVADAMNSRIQQFDRQGQYVRQWGVSGNGPGQFSLPYGVAVDSEGYVYVADRGNNRIQRFLANGQYVGQWGVAGAGPGQMNEPYAVAVDQNGFVYVADEGNQRIQKFTRSGVYVADWRVNGYPLGIAVDRAGNTYVTAAYAGQGVIKYSPTGEVLGSWPQAGMNVYGVAVDEAGSVYVGRFDTNRIAKFGADGSLAVEWGGTGTDPGQFGFPTGMAASGGALFVSESGNQRIQVFRLRESQVIQAVTPAGVASPNIPVLNVPVTIARDIAMPSLGYSVRLHLSGVALSGGGGAGITEGTFLSSVNPSTAFQVTDNGGGAYTVDNVILGPPCGATSLSGTLFSVAVTSSAPSGPGYVVIDQATVFDCNNVPTSYAVGAPAPVAIDNTPPVVTLTGPNGGEISPQEVTWSASDNVNMASVDLALSVDGGATFPFVIANGLSNAGSYAWTPPPVRTTQARVRVTAHDVNGNVASDVSDADFTLGRYRLQVNVSNGSVMRVPDLPSYDDQVEILITATPAPGYHFVRWSGDVISTDNPLAIALSAHTTLNAEMEVNPPVPAITALTTSRVTAGNDADGTVKVQVSWPAVGPGQSVQVYRAGFGGYPQYDGAGGAIPVVPTYPPSSPWVLTDVTSSGGVDETASRDAYYYVAFVTDFYGTVSPASNLAGGTLNYLLGDFSDGATAGHGDNQVGAADVSLLGFHYGASGGALAGFEYLDVGPTSDRTVSGRPTTDGRINIEDLLILGLNYGTTAVPATRLQPVATSGPEQVSLRLSDSVDDGLEAHVEMRGTGAAQGLSAALGWNAEVVEPVACEMGPWLADQSGIALSATPGIIDAVLLGARSRGLHGFGEIATVRFKRLRPGDAGIVIRSVMARDVANHDVPVVIQRASLTAVPGQGFDAVLPNPFQRTTTLAFSLSRPGPVELEVFSIDGRKVRLLSTGNRDAGEYRVEWDGLDERGRPVTAGVYFAQLRTTAGTERRRVVRLN